MACEHFASTIADSVGADAAVEFDLTTASLRPMIAAWVSAAISQLDASRWHHAWRRLEVPADEELTLLAIAEAKHTAGDLFRSFRGRGPPEVPPVPFEPEIEGVDVPEYDDDGLVDLLQEPDEAVEPGAAEAELTMGEEPAVGEPGEETVVGEPAEETVVGEPAEEPGEKPAEEPPAGAKVERAAGRRVLTQLERLMALRIVYGDGRGPLRF